MLISHEWLSAFVPHGKSPEELRDLLSAHVATVDGMERLREDLRDIVVARVVEAGRHPDSDHLWVTRVDDGSGTLLAVVCGAPNVSVGTLYPFARTGVTLPGGLRIEKRKIRGETSNGMLCSVRELGLGEEQEGIMALDVDAAPGTPFLAAVPVSDVRFDVDVLPNRPDLLSHLGVARDVAAVTGVAVGDPAELLAGVAVPGLVSGATEAASGGASVRIDDVSRCPRYMGVVIRGVKVASSPDWLVRRLGSVGLRSISNIVDATNYLLYGYGQPMHAFDLGKIPGGRIVVRRAAPGELLVTLDGVTRTLDERMTVIADAQRPIALAGVMGGRDTEVTAATTDLFLEVACFSPADVRMMRKALGMSTEASYRFERGIHAEGMPHALELAARLIVQVAGGRIDGAPIDVGTVTARRAPVLLRPSRLNTLLGERLTSAEMTRLLASVGFVVEPETEDVLRVEAPGWRHDVGRDVDLVEEVARLRGYDVLSDELRPFRPGTVPEHPLQVTGRRVRDLLVGLGFTEVRPLPFVKGDDASHVRVRNPLAEDEPHLRNSILESLARRAEYNLSRMNGNLRLFEVGSAFTPRSGQALPDEEVRVGVICMGASRPPHFTEPAPRAFDLWDAKSIAVDVLRVAHPGSAVQLVTGEGDDLWRVVGPDGVVVGRVARVPLDRPVWSHEPFGIEILLGRMPNEDVAPPGKAAHLVTRAPAERHVKYRALPVTPPAEFDLALLVPDGITAAQVEGVLRGSGGELLESVVVFDEYRGEGVAAGTRSVAWRLTFRDPVRTLRDKEVEGRRQKILKALEGALGVRPRSA